MSTAPFVVVVFGPIGVGKSTVVECLARSTTRRVVAIREPVAAMVESGALAAVADNRSSSGYVLQMIVLSERLSSYWRAQAAIDAEPVDSARAPPTVVCDGHLMLDATIFTAEHVRAGRMSSKERGLYDSAVYTMLAHSPTFAQRPHMYVYLHASAPQCLARSVERGRSEETRLDVHQMQRYISRCDELVKSLAAEGTTAVVTVRTDGTSADDVAAQVEQLITTHANAYSAHGGGDLFASTSFV